MKRSAFLIGSNNAAHGSLEGVEKDLDDLQRFLQSDHGGAWEPSELHRFPNPSGSLLRRSLQLAGIANEYLMLAFGGHGGQDTSGPYVCLSNSEDVLISDLKSHARRQLILVDACRTLAPANLPAGISKIAELAETVLVDAAYRASCRLAYDSALESAEEGTVVLLACSEHQEAGESKEGGLFTQSLIRLSARWARETSTQARAHTTRDALEAFTDAQSWTLAHNPPQNPVKQHGRRRRYFPFAVA